VVLLTDGFSAKEADYVTHQVFDQAALLAPLTKATTRLESGDVPAQIEALLDAATTQPFGPVMIELTSETAKARVTTGFVVRASAAPESAAAPAEIAEISALLARARRPVIVVGLEARDDACAKALRALAEALACPVLTTYKAKGAFPDSHSLHVGHFTSGAAEAECVGAADLIILCGLDPVELLRQPWRYEAPVIDISAVPHAVHYLSPAAGLYGAISAHLAALTPFARASDWRASEVAGLRDRMTASLAYVAGRGLGPQEVVQIALRESGSVSPRPRITVDAGAHMFSAMAFWRSESPCDALISNGLATMAFALPAAIAASLHDPNRTTIAFTGDGGLLMCLGELSTAVQQRVRIVVIVFNDASLSLIDIKQQQRKLETRGVRWDRPDFAETMRAMGGRGLRATDAEGLRRGMAEALQCDGPVLIDVAVDPDGYSDQLKALRG
jgi:acetolactate synthase-1/2/3 large subunit